LGGTALAHVANAIAVSRSFFGTLSVVPQNMDDAARAAYCLKHGRVGHGCQLRAEGGRQMPTTHYGPACGVGIAMLTAASNVSASHGTLRIGTVGLGVGTIAAYGKPG